MAYKRASRVPTWELLGMWVQEVLMNFTRLFSSTFRPISCPLLVITSVPSVLELRAPMNTGSLDTLPVPMTEAVEISITKKCPNLVITYNRPCLDEMCMNTGKSFGNCGGICRSHTFLSFCWPSFGGPRRQRLATNSHKMGR